MKKQKKVANDATSKNKLRFWDKEEFRNYFVRLFGKYDFRNEEQFLSFAKWLLYSLLILVEILLFWQQWYKWGTKEGRITNIILLGFEGTLLLSEGLKFFVFQNGHRQTAFFVTNVISACIILFCSKGTYPIIIYIVILSELYIGARKFSQSLLVFTLAMPIYAVCYTAKQLTWLDIGLPEIFRESLGTILALTVHFLAMHVALAFYRQYLRLDKTLQELNESKKELEKAYAVVAEVSALEERQRIAKEIHDTAGHSITTVIMQTESAKRILEENPDEAKTKIVAANLQAKHALEELRESVHLLSGNTAKQTLKTALESIIHESTDGTGIKIRSEIEEVTTISEAKFRFLCNTLKEGISNGLRHGKATAFWFEFKREGNSLHFLLSDNGTGAGTSLTLGFGLSTMQEKARSLGGEAYFESLDEGFELRLVLPMDTEE
jgi:signal transduction histidine kinase